MLMRNTSPLLFIILLCGLTANAQKASLKGLITDTVNKKQLANSSIIVLKKTDSSLVKFTRSKENGSFFLPSLDTGQYLLVISFPSFADYSDEIIIRGTDIDLGTVYLTPKSKLMEEIIVKKNNPCHPVQRRYHRV